MGPNEDRCPDCTDDITLDRRDLLRAGLGLAAGLPLFATARAAAAPSPSSPAETAVKALYDSLTDDQKKQVCFDWAYVDPPKGTGKDRGLLRTHVSNNWEITQHFIRSDFYTRKQQDIIHDIFRGMINPEWYARFLKQLKDDTDGMDWGAKQSIAIFGKPGSDKFEFVMTGRHMTLRADGNTSENVAFGGPIFYGHAASGFREMVGHPNNVFWPQALAANKVFQLLDPKQQEKTLVAKLPHEAEVAFQGPKGQFPGISVAELAEEQKKALQQTLQLLLEPYRKEDSDEALECMKKQGGLDKCFLGFYKDGRGEGRLDGKNYDNWRLEGPSFVWYFRGMPHVHVWVNIADDPTVKLNARG